MGTENNICPLCREGHLQSRVDQEVTEYKGQKALTPLYYSECDFCGSEQSDASQTRDNKRAMLKFKKQVEGLLSGEEIKALRKGWGINQAEAAIIFGGGPVAFSKYESDDVVQAESMDKLLRIASDQNIFIRLALDAGINVSSKSVFVKNKGDYAPSQIKQQIENKSKKCSPLCLVWSKDINQGSTEYNKPRHVA